VKRLVYFTFAVIVILSLTGCRQSKSFQDTNASTATSAFVAAAPRMTPTLSPNNFDISRVEMQSTQQSTCFSEVGYDPDWAVLVVRFRDSGSVYTYSDFPQDQWDTFIAADSLGSWYNTYIKGQYDCEKIS